MRKLLLSSAAAVALLGSAMVNPAHAIFQIEASQFASAYNEFGPSLELKSTMVRITTREALRRMFGIVLGDFATEREAALAYDRAALMIYGDDADTNFPPEESEHVVFPDEVMRQINAMKAGKGRLH
jgi:hypothetical protein